VETSTANLTLNESELYVDRGIAWCARQMQFVPKRLWRLAKFNFVNVTPTFDLIGDEMPRSDVCKAQPALRIHNLGGLPHYWLLTAKIKTPTGLVTRTRDDLPSQFDSSLDHKAHREPSGPRVMASIDMMHRFSFGVKTSIDVCSGGRLYRTESTQRVP
jgi:hypothetical protein